VKVKTNLTQSEVEALKATGFTIDDGNDDSPNSHTEVRPPSVSVLESRAPSSSGDLRPTSRDGKLFRYVPVSSEEHRAKLLKSISIDCSVVKYLEVPPPGYGIVYTVHTPGSIAKQQLYEVTIGYFPSCTCIDFISMKANVLGNGKKKWIYCKHVYFIFQRFMGYTTEDNFVHCPTWTVNEVKMMLGRVDAISLND
jgi:hypothetical protein